MPEFDQNPLGPQAPVRIALLSASDAPQYKRLMLHAYEHATDAFTSTLDERAAQPEGWWVERIADPKGLGIAFGAFKKGELVATVALGFSERPKSRHKAAVIGMYVLPEHRGDGVGSALLHRAIEHCQSLGSIQSMTLTVTEGNESALSLYRRLGFEVFGIEPMAMLTADGFKAKIHMWRGLSGADTSP